MACRAPAVSHGTSRSKVVAVWALWHAHPRHSHSRHTHPRHTHGHAHSRHCHRWQCHARHCSRHRHSRHCGSWHTHCRHSWSGRCHTGRGGKVHRAVRIGHVHAWLGTLARVHVAGHGLLRIHGCPHVHIALHTGGIQSMHHAHWSRCTMHVHSGVHRGHLLSTWHAHVGGPTQRRSSCHMAHHRLYLMHLLRVPTHRGFMQHLLARIQHRGSLVGVVAAA
mmetsp:Transcript_119921/g.224189  ORF Transcript_119921/g.224189 Transcript_119921/m.224189 type:complete len:221 (+) Transcript_119921:40-702(+)